MTLFKTSTAAVALILAGSTAFAQDATTTEPMTNDPVVETDMTDTATGTEMETDMETDMANTDMGDMQNFDLTTSENLIRTRDIVGGQVWRMNAMEDNSVWTDNGTYEGAGEDWERIGSIEDIVLSNTGQMIGIVGEVGGFLGLGDKMVLMPVQDVRLTALDDGTFAYVTQLTREEIEAAQDVDEGFWE